MILEKYGSSAVVLEILILASAKKTFYEKNIFLFDSFKSFVF